MPTFELKTPDGRTFDIEAADIASAHKAIAHAFGSQQAAAPSPSPMASSATARGPMDALAHMAAGTGFGTAIAAQPPAPPAAPEPAVLDGAAQNRVYGLARVIASGRGAMPSIQGAVTRLPQAERDALSRVLTSWGGGGGATPSPIGERT